jgi:glycosyltransferase involved in cell wall biosynthesis
MGTVVIDIRSNHDTGVARYGLSLLKALVPRIADHDLRLVIVTTPAHAERAHSAVASGSPSLIRIEVCPDEEGFVRRSPWVKDLIIASHADLFFTTHYSVARDCPVPFVVTIHDLTRLRFPDASYSDESFAASFGEQELALLDGELQALSVWDEPIRGGHESRFVRYFWAFNRFLAARAMRVVTVSAASAADLRTVLDIPRERISVVPAGVDIGAFHPRPASAVARLRRRYGLSGPFCLYVGLTHPHKRFPWLVRSLLERRKALPQEAKLVAVGGYAEHTPGIHDLITELQGQDFVVFTGRVTDEDLATLYSCAAALLISSLNEGGGLPGIEALACRCEVIATDIPALRETLGEFAHFYAPSDAETLVRLTAAALDERLGHRAASFSPPRWEDAGARLVEVLGIALTKRSSSY